MRGFRSKASPPRLHQRGMAAVEFALVFPIFFALFYGLVNWGLILTLQHNLNYAAQNAARAALKVDLDAFGGDVAAYKTKVTDVTQAAAGQALDWLPADWKERVLGDGNGQVGVDFETETLAGETVDSLRVSIRYPNYSDNPLLPSMAGFPPVPEQLLGEATLRL